MEDKGIRILMTTDTVGGVWTFALELCKALKSYGYVIHLMGLGGKPSEAQQEEVDTLDNVTFYKSNFKLEWMKDPWKDVYNARRWFFNLCMKVRPHLVHFNNYMWLEDFRPCPIITVYHSCVQTWWQAVKGTSAPSEWNPYLHWMRHALNASDKVIFPTQAFRKEALAVHQLAVPTEIILNGRSSDFCRTVPKEKIIICTGRIWDEAKNLQTICRMAHQLPWPVYVAGDNIHPGTGKAVELKNVRFLGKLCPEEMHYWLEGTEIYINPAKYEPFGLAVLEAAKAGCVLALSKIDTLQELWGNTAEFFDPEDPEEIINVVIKLIENAEYRQELRKRSKAKAEAYNINTMGMAYHRLYGQLTTTEKLMEIPSQVNN